MPTILVVDDAAVDRRLVGGLLARSADWKVDYAAQGVEALEKMDLAPPDLVLTDLVMPEMDGLELVAAVRRRYPHVPVILMTSRGSEEIAVQALQQGAASYVPKRLLAKRLTETIQRVLAIASRLRCHAQLLGCMSRIQCTFELANDHTLMEALVAYLQDSLVQMGLCDPTECTRIGIALEEALVNAMHHGNLEVSSDPRGECDEAYYALVARRRQESPYQDRRVFVEANLSRDEAVFVVRDEGPGFDLAKLPDPDDPAGLERVGGRGMLLMQAFMDEVTYNDRGNAVMLVKRRKTADPLATEAA
jgi:CheY-like chemotaxis protein/anti-sigma regulatory factor (Ser/Thr protein kinase)